MKELILATNNKNKVSEMKEKLSKYGINVLSQSEAGVNIDAEETGERKCKDKSKSCL